MPSLEQRRVGPARVEAEPGGEARAEAEDPRTHRRRLSGRGERGAGEGDGGQDAARRGVGERVGYHADGGIEAA